MAKAKKPTARKKTASFGQFDSGRGTKAARSKTVASTDPRTITGAKLNKRQREALARANRRKG